MFCSSHGGRMELSFVFCPNCGKKRSDNNRIQASKGNDAEKSRTSTGKVSGCSESENAMGRNKNVPLPSLPQFMKKKEAERSWHFQPKKEESTSGHKLKESRIGNYCWLDGVPARIVPSTKACVWKVISR